MSSLVRMGMLIALAGAPAAMVERAKQCARPPTGDDAHPLAIRRDVGMHWLDRSQCRFQRVSEPDAGVSLIEWGMVTTPVQTKEGWQLGECITRRRVQTSSSTIETGFRCEAPQFKLKEIESHPDGTAITRLFNKDSGVLEQRYTDRALFDGERALRCERFSADGGVAELIEYGVRIHGGCVPVGSPFVPGRPIGFESYNRR